RRAPHEPRHVGVGPRHGPQLRTHDRRRDAEGGPVEPRGDRGLPRGGTSVPLLQLTDVRARYGQVRALHGVTLTVEEGEVVALLGANGAGKTTTLRAISGMVARSGELKFDGAPLAKSPEGAARRGITHVPEGRGILAELTVWENLTMGAYLRRDRKAVKTDLEMICGE